MRTIKRTLFVRLGLRFFLDKSRGGATAKASLSVRPPISKDEVEIDGFDSASALRVLAEPVSFFTPAFTLVSELRTRPDGNVALCFLAALRSHCCQSNRGN